MSLKRTVFDGLREAEAGAGSEDAAWAKSAAREESLGEVRVFALEGELKPWNWAVRSSNCFCSEDKESAVADAALVAMPVSPQVSTVHARAQASGRPQPKRRGAVQPVGKK